MYSPAKEKYFQHVSHLSGVEREKGLVDFAMTHRIGRMMGNRERVVKDLHILGNKIREFHNTGYRPEEYLERVIERQTYLRPQDKEKTLEVLEKGINRDFGWWGRLSRKKREREVEGLVPNVMLEGKKEREWKPVGLRRFEKRGNT